MTQIIENWSWLTGRVVSAQAEEQETQLDALIESAMPVDGFRNLFDQFVGMQIRISLPLRDLPAVGTRFTLKARLIRPASARGLGETFKVVG